MLKIASHLFLNKYFKIKNKIVEIRESVKELKSRLGTANERSSKLEGKKDDTRQVKQAKYMVMVDDLTSDDGYIVQYQILYT